MFGNNPIRSAQSHNGESLQVKKIFLTIQGEGEFSGHPSVFIRLGGCNLACKFCDTEFEDFVEMQLQEIIDTVLQYKQQHSITYATITGGEPLRQPIEKLCSELLAINVIPQIETNGTLFRNLPLTTKIICSPKATKHGYVPIRQDLLPCISSLKFLISKFHQYYDTVPEVGQLSYNIPVFIQPMDEYDAHKNKINIEHALSLSKKYGYRISLQTHKFLNIE